MKVLPLERHTYFIINVIHNTYSTYSIYIQTGLVQVFLISANPYFHKQIQYSPLTYKSRNRTHKRYSQLTPHTHSLPGWQVLYLQRMLWIEGFLKGIPMPCSNSSPCLLLVKEADVSLWIKDSFFCLNIFIKMNLTMLNALGRSRVAVTWISQLFCARWGKNGALPQ